MTSNEVVTSNAGQFLRTYYYEGESNNNLSNHPSNHSGLFTTKSLYTIYISLLSKNLFLIFSSKHSVMICFAVVVLCLSEAEIVRKILPFAIGHIQIKLVLY